MANYHSVEQGEHLSGIALKYGFSDYHTIWDHPENAELKKLRKNPNVLFPTDRLFIPERGVKDYSRSTEKKHHFKLLTKPLQLRIRLEKGYDAPIANTKCDLIVESNVHELTSDGKGQIEQPISKTAEIATLVIKDSVMFKGAKVPFEVQLPVKIGHLDPVEEQSGQLGRLTNLGYYLGSIDEPERAEILSAIEEFQCEHNLTVDGKCGPNTQAKLKEVHGC